MRRNIALFGIAVSVLLVGSRLFAQSGHDQQKRLHLSEPIEQVAVFDLPSKQLGGSASKLFRGESIASIVAIPDSTLKARSILGPIAQEFINVVRSDAPFKKLNSSRKWRIAGLVLFKSGKAALIRQSEDGKFLLVQIGQDGGELESAWFPNLFGIRARAATPSNADDATGGEPVLDEVDPAKRASS
jgi:hypothetical protein